MNFKKPKFWDKKKPNILAYLLLPFTLLTLAINKLVFTNSFKNKNIKTICVGNIYLGGTGKTPLAIEIKKILDQLNYKTAFAKKYYPDQIDEQKILSENGKIFCHSQRIDSINKAQEENTKILIFDDGLQDKKINYDLSIVCFNNEVNFGNRLLLPAGPLRESLKNLKKYDVVFLNGNFESDEDIKNEIFYYNSSIELFEAKYSIVNSEILDKNKKYLVFCGIGNPKTFRKTLDYEKINIVEFQEFPDHYEYSDEEIYLIKEKAKKIGAEILTTEKDYKRLVNFDLSNINYLKIKLKIKNLENFKSYLKKKI